VVKKIKIEYEIPAFAGMIEEAGMTKGGGMTRKCGG